MTDKTPLTARLDCADGRRLGDLTLIERDLKQTVALCDRILAVLGQPKADQVVIEGLWTAALVAYARCFASGKRIPLGQALFDSVAPHWKKEHEFFSDLRSKHIAHSVNEFEQVQVGVQLHRPDINRRGVVCTVVSMRHVFTASFEKVNSLRALASVVLTKVSAELSGAEARLRATADALLLVDLYALPPIEHAEPDYERVARPRR